MARDLPGLDDCVECLAELAGPGPVLELGVGTGRVALPLVQRGLVVDGIDASPAMLAKLRAKPGGDRVRVTVGDMAEVGVDASYSLVFVVFNTLFALVSQDEQVRCFANVAGRLAEGGVFVVEAFVPDPGGGQAVRAPDRDLGRLPLVGGGAVDLLAALGLAEDAAEEREAGGTDVKQWQAQMAYRAWRVEG